MYRSEDFCVVYCERPRALVNDAVQYARTELLSVLCILFWCIRSDYESGRCLV
jgi:hypothetical protein